MHRSAALLTGSAIAFAFAALASSPASAIDTFKDWNGTDYFENYGCPNSTTYGQVITVPAGKSHLNGFTFWWQNLNGSRGSMVVRGEVYAWDGRKASGTNLYESEPRTISFGDDKFHKENFLAAISVTPGMKYVLFASIDKDYEQCTNNYQLDWGAVGNIYHKGRFVFQNNGGNEGSWTTQAWNKKWAGGSDLAMKVVMAP